MASGEFVDEPITDAPTHRRCRKPAIPAELRKEIVRHARDTARKYRDLFDRDHELKNKVLRLERRCFHPGRGVEAARAIRS